MFNKALKTAFTAVIGSALLLAGGCGKNTAENQIIAGPVGPTMSGYYFKVLVAPAIVPQTGSVVVVIWVTDAAGQPVDGTVPPAATLSTAAKPGAARGDVIPVRATSTDTSTSTSTDTSTSTSTDTSTTTATYIPLTVYVGGGGTFTSNSAPVDKKGIARGTMTISATAAGTRTLTFILEDRTLSIPIQILAY